MVRKWIYRAAVCILPLAMLAACGDGSEAAMDEKTLNTLEMVAMDDDTSPEEGPGEELADEISLQYLTGDLTPEGQAQVLEAMTDLQRNLEIPEYLGEGIHLVSDAAWLETMSRELYEGSRNYVLQRGGEMLLSVQVGLDMEGKVSVNVFYPGQEGKVLVLKHEDGAIWMLQTGLADGKYDGAFEIWQMNGTTGHIRREQGSYAAGTVVGEYTKSEYAGAPGDVFDMWTNRENFVYE